ncbi:MAG: FecR family protein [Acidobacteriota bacterium]
MFSLRSAWSGNSIQLQRGDIIVQAAKQRRGHLRVQTRDSLTSVKGTVFAVSAGLSGTLVSVIEGSVAVAYSGTDVLLSPGEQEATNPALESSVEQAISWSPDAETFAGMLASLVQVAEQISEIPLPQLRPESRLLQFMPPNMLVYGAVPNLGDNLDQAISLMEQQASENSDFSQWWDFGGGEKLRDMTNLVQTITAHLGNEIVFGLSAGTTGGEEIPVILADVLPGEEAQLQDALAALNSEATPLPYYLVETLLLASDTQQNLDWLLGNLGQGASSSFASELAARYNSGLSWLFGINISSILTQSGDTAEFPPAQQVKHLFFDQRNVMGIDENEVTVTFNGPRVGLTSFMTNTGSGLAAEYITGDSLAAAYIATREPQQLFEELIAQLVPMDPSILDELDQAEFELGIDLSNDLARAFGTESAFSLEGISTAGPAWTMAVLVNDSYTLEDSVRKLVEVCNLKLEGAGQARRIHYSQDTIDGRTWTTIQPDWVPMSVTWTYDEGFMVASSDRATALRAITTRNGGMPLIWSSPFQQQLPVSAGLHPSGFAWLNTKGALQNLANLVSNTTIRELITERDPILVAFDAESEQIRAVSRTRLSSVLMDMMLLQGVSRTQTEQQ